MIDLIDKNEYLLFLTRAPQEKKNDTQPWQVKKSTGFNGRVNDIKSGSIQYKIKGKEVDLMHAHNQQGFVVPFSNFSMFTRCVTVVKFSTSL